MWLLLFAVFLQAPAHADSPHLPPEMRQKVQDLGAALHESYVEAQLRVRSAEKDSGVVRSLVTNAGRFWGAVKAKGRSALVYLDHELHEHVLGADIDAPRDRSGQPPRHDRN